MKIYVFQEVVLSILFLIGELYKNTNFKNTFNLNYINIKPSTIFLQSQNKEYVNEFIREERI